MNTWRKCLAHSWCSTFLWVFLFYTLICSAYLSWSPLLKTYFEASRLFLSALSQFQRSNLWASSCRNTPQLCNFRAPVLGGGFGKDGAFLGSSDTVAPPSMRPQAAWQTGRFSRCPLGSKHLIRLSEGRQRKEMMDLLPGCSFHQLLRSLRKPGVKVSWKMSYHNALYSGSSFWEASIVSTENIHSWSKEAGS